MCRSCSRPCRPPLPLAPWSRSSSASLQPEGWFFSFHTSLKGCRQPDMRTPVAYLLQWVGVSIDDARCIEAQRELLGEAGAQPETRARNGRPRAIGGAHLARIEESQATRPDVTAAQVRGIALEVPAHACLASHAAFGKAAHRIGAAEAHLLALDQRVIAPLPAQRRTELPGISDQLRVVRTIAHHAIKIGRASCRERV